MEGGAIILSEVEGVWTGVLYGEGAPTVRFTKMFLCLRLKRLLFFHFALTTVQTVCSRPRRRRVGRTYFYRLTLGS